MPPNTYENFTIELGENINSIAKWNTLAMTSANRKITLEINEVITAETDASAHSSG